MPDALLRRVPGVFINDISGNPFQPDVQYRGFRLARARHPRRARDLSERRAHQRGVRRYRELGLHPGAAINRLDVGPSDPIFGLNALGGAITIEMKNGFTYQGRETEVTRRLVRRRSAGAQVGAQQAMSRSISWRMRSTTTAGAIARRRAAPHLRRCRRARRPPEFHINFTGASNSFGAAATTPIQMLNRSGARSYTTPQTYQNQLAFLNATGSYQPPTRLTFKGKATIRLLAKARRRQHFRFEPCDAAAPGFSLPRRRQRPSVRY